MADLLDAVNFLEIQNAKSGNRNEARLRDLEGRAQYIAKKTGQEPVSWYEFSQSVPAEKPNYLTNAMIGAGFGAAILGGVASIVASTMVVPLVVSGVIFGGLLGGYHNTENTSRGKQVDAYEQYLNQFEMAQRSISQINSALATQFSRIDGEQNHFRESLIAKRAAEKEKDCSCSK